jgi:hypothetical protein
VAIGITETQRMSSGSLKEASAQMGPNRSCEMRAGRSSTGGK